MTDELEQGAPPAEEGAAPAAPPVAPEAPPAEKTPEQLAADKKTADEAESKQKEADEAEEQATRKKPWFQKRIDEMSKQRHEAERRAERLERMVEQLVQRAPQQEQQAQKPPPLPPQDLAPTRPAPTREQFEYDEDKYVQAVVGWQIEQRDAATMRQRSQEQQQRAQQDFQADFNGRANKIMTDGAAKYPDFEDAVRSVPGNVFDMPTALAISETDSPVEITYHLAKHPEEAAKLAKMSPLKKAVELGKLEAKITAAAKPRTNAPPPPKPVGGKEPGTVRESDMSMDEWLKQREAGKITGLT